MIEQTEFLFPTNIFFFFTSNTGNLPDIFLFFFLNVFMQLKLQPSVLKN